MLLDMQHGEERHSLYHLAVVRSYVFLKATNVTRSGVLKGQDLLKE